MQIAVAVKCQFTCKSGILSLCWHFYSLMHFQSSMKSLQFHRNSLVNVGKSRFLMYKEQGKKELPGYEQCIQYSPLKFLQWKSRVHKYLLVHLQQLPSKNYGLEFHRIFFFLHKSSSFLFILFSLGDLNSSIVDLFRFTIGSLKFS